MKKILLTVMTVGLTASVFAQGVVNFSNFSGTGVTGRVDTNNPVGVAASGSYNVGLYWGVLGSSEAQLVLIAEGAGNFSSGRFSLGNATTGVGTAAGADGIFEVKAWTGSLATYEAAYAAAVAGGGQQVGVSGTFQNSTGGAGTPPSTPSNLTGWTTGVILNPVPEPTTLALGGLGAAALLLFRRRK